MSCRCIYRCPAYTLRTDFNFDECTFHGTWNPCQTTLMTSHSISIQESGVLCLYIENYRCALIQPPEVTTYGSGCALLKIHISVQWTLFTDFRSTETTMYNVRIYIYIRIYNRSTYTSQNKHISRPIKTRFAINKPIFGRALQCLKHSSAENYCTHMHRIKETPFSLKRQMFDRCEWNGLVSERPYE